VRQNLQSEPPMFSSPRCSLDTVPIMSIGVVGLGYVGLPLVVAFAQAGEEVIAVDIDPRKVERSTQASPTLEDIPPRCWQRPVREGADATSHYAPLLAPSGDSFCVPTPR